MRGECDLRGLTFEVRRNRRQDAGPGLVRMYAYHQTGPDGLPLDLASTEELGLSGVGILTSVWMLFGEVDPKVP